MTDRTYDTLLAVAGILAGLYFFLREKDFSSVTVLPPQSTTAGGNPIERTFTAAPQQFTPQAIGPQTINIENQGFAYLTNKYIPLFGFVGIAQNSTYAQ